MIFVGRPFLFRSSQRSSTEVLVSFPSFSSGQCSVNMSNITGPRTYFQRIILPSMICKLVIFFAFGALEHAVSLSRSVSTALFAESLSFSMASSENKRPSSFAALSLFYEIGCIAFKEQLRATLKCLGPHCIFSSSRICTLTASLTLFFIPFDFLATGPLFLSPWPKLLKLFGHIQESTANLSQRLSSTYSSIMI